MTEFNFVVESDGAAKGNGSGPAGAGFVVYNALDNKCIYEHGHFLGESGITNNVAEYKSLILALQHIKTIAETSEISILVKMDSLLVVSQINGKWKINKPHLVILASEAQKLISEFKHVELIWIGRDQNIRADKLANKAIIDHK